mgnify:CR=1 FL=1
MPVISPLRPARIRGREARTPGSPVLLPQEPDHAHGQDRPARECEQDHRNAHRTLQRRITRSSPIRAQVTRVQAAAALLSRTAYRPAAGAASRLQVGGGNSKDERAMSMARL